MNMMSEDVLRNRLANDISSIEPGMTLLEKEKFVPNEIGTRSFIDLFARDKDGLLVLIELKRSRAASREAIHEILKYVEGVKRHLAIREDELRVIVASTEWGELLVPFSRLLKETTIQVQGLKLSVAPDKVYSETVQPVPVEQGRNLAPWHEVRFYQSRDELRRGIADIETRYKTNNVQDYVLLILYALEPQTAKHQMSIRTLLTAIEGSSKKLMDVQSIPAYRYCVYAASQLLAEQKYWDLLMQNKEAYEAAKEEAEDMEGDELLQYLHDFVCSMGSDFFESDFEIGSAAKLKSQLLDDEQWKIWGLLRYGTFERNPLLTDETIVDELCGSEGHTGQRFSRDFSISNKSQLASVREGVDRCLEFNPDWAKAIHLALDEIEKDYPHATVQLRIFTPSAGLLTIYYILTKENGLLYLPNFSLIVTHENQEVRSYLGCLMGISKPEKLQTILDRFYDGSISGVMFSLSWGGYTAKDSEVLAACGLKYSCLKRDLRQDPLQLWRLADGSWVRIPDLNPFDALMRGFGKPSAFLAELISEISKRDHGIFYEL